MLKNRSIRLQLQTEANLAGIDPVAGSFGQKKMTFPQLCRKLSFSCFRASNLDQGRYLAAMEIAFSFEPYTRPFNADLATSKNVKAKAFPVTDTLFMLDLELGILAAQHSSFERRDK